jgi:uncharacterized protein YndB with AHSA1/START domain
MTVSQQSKIVHNTFRIERTYDASPERVFAAFSDPERKAKWFSGPEPWVIYKREFDFRVGGREVVTGGPKGEAAPSSPADCAISGSTFDARYFDIIPNQRIVYAYDMYVGGRKLSVSLATIELTAQGKSTRLVMTEQGAFLDGAEDGSEREAGTQWLLDKLGKSL